MAEQWQPLLEASLNAGIKQQRRLSGGDFANSRCVTLDNDIRVFVKTHNNPPAHFFSTEATDNPPCLALEWIQEGPRRNTAEAVFGQQLAALHQQPFSTFGRPDLRTTGSLGLANQPCDTWAGFFRSQRLLPLAQIAEERGALGKQTCQHIRSVAEQLEQFAPPDHAPSLVHGDLWAGNRIIDEQNVSWLIDPAAHGNHREFDIAMMHLFGGYGDACFAAYDEAYPLDEGWRDRIPLHQLAPLIVHAIKFGGHYAAATDEALSRFVS